MHVLSQQICLKKNIDISLSDEFDRREQMLAEFMKLHEIKQINFGGVVDFYSCLLDFIEKDKFDTEELQRASVKLGVECKKVFCLQEEFENANYDPSRRHVGHQAIYVHDFTLSLIESLKAAAKIKDKRTRRHIRTLFSNALSEANPDLRL